MRVWGWGMCACVRVSLNCNSVSYQMLNSPGNTISNKVNHLGSLCSRTFRNRRMSVALRITNPIQSFLI